MKSNLHNVDRRLRVGLSVLEFLGCMIALIGGAWLGAMYLGIDLRRVAYVALAESDVIDKMPESWRPAAPEGVDKKPTSAELAKEVQSELASLHGDISALRSSHEPNSAGSDVPASSPNNVGEESAKQRTLDYWKQIEQVVREHAAMQLKAESTATESNATKLAALKARINRFAAKALQAIPTEGVDRAALELNQELVSWYDRSGDLFEQAVGLLDSAVRTQGTALTKDWDFAQLQLRNEAKLLGDKTAAVRDSLSRRFGAEFPEIAGP